MKYDNSLRVYLSLNKLEDIIIFYNDKEIDIFNFLGDYDYKDFIVTDVNVICKFGHLYKLTSVELKEGADKYEKCVH